MLDEPAELYERSAGYYDDYFDFLDYPAASERLLAWVRRFNPGARTLLDVACGTGKHLECLREHFQVEGLDLNPVMLDIARKRCPGVPLHQGDMTDFRLEDTFDVVTCLFSSVALVKTLDLMERAVRCMANHLIPGGVLIVEPWVTPEKCWSNKVTADFTDRPELKIVRMYTHEIEGRLSIFDINYLIGTPRGVTHFIEREELGLFTSEEYVGAFERAGLDVVHDEDGLFGYGLYVGVKR